MLLYLYFIPWNPISNDTFLTHETDVINWICYGFILTSDCHIYHHQRAFFCPYGSKVRQNTATFNKKITMYCKYIYDR